MKRNRRVLIADDDRALCKMIAAALRNVDFDAEVRFDAESAIAVAREEPLDLIICDFMLPGMSGIDMVERLREDRFAGDLPIIVISAHAAYGVRRLAMSAGADAFLAKPFSLAQLRGAVAATIDRPRLKAVSNI